MLMPICTVRMVTELVICSGHMYWFHVLIKQYTASALIAGMETGIRIRQKNRQSVQPSMVAASRNSLGTVKTAGASGTPRTG